MSCERNYLEVTATILNLSEFCILTALKNTLFQYAVYFL